VTSNTLSASEVAGRLRDGKEIAFIDVREHGQYGEAHPLRVVSIPYSVLEARIESFVPRPNTRVVLLDEGDGIAGQAARALSAMRYTHVEVLEGGMPAWAAAGLEVYQGVNVVCKAFGEVVEHACETPAIDPAELKAMVDAGEKLVIVDGRTPEEFNRMSIPGGASVPNAELVYRIGDIAPDPNTTVVVNCAGRTRSIIGAQTLRNAGIPNKVVALRGGTMAWRLSGFGLDHGETPVLPALTEGSIDSGKAYAAEMRARFGLTTADAGQLGEWQAEPERTTYLIDVRSSEEFAAGHMPGAMHAPGGQLVQAADQWCAVWRARMVLVDEGSGVRASTTAHWMKQMGWDVHVLLTDFAGDASEMGLPPRLVPNLEGTGVQLIEQLKLKQLIERGEVTLVDVDDSTVYRQRRLPGASWSVRPRIVDDVKALPSKSIVVLYSEHETRARLAARDLIQDTRTPVGVLKGGRQAWMAAGGAVEVSGGEPDDGRRIDYLFFVHDRHMGNDDAARAYLAWEENLPAQLRNEGEDDFPLVLI